jgi:hypothetical protein
MSGWQSGALTNADLPALNFRNLAGLFKQQLQTALKWDGLNLGAACGRD